MRNIFKSLFVFTVCLMANAAFAATPAVTITASETQIADWNMTYNAGTANEITLSTASGVAMASKKPCGVSANQTVLSLSSSDTHYLAFELPSGSSATIDSILIRCSGNSSGTSDWFSPLFYCPETSFNESNVTGVVDIHFTGYNQACQDVMAQLPSGIKSCRFYRRVKYTSGNPGSIGSGSNYGSGQTTNIAYIEIYMSGSSTPTVSSDATLSSLVYGSDQTSVPNFSPNQEHYDVELPATYVGGAPSIQGTTTDANANITSVTQATSIPGTASITVTAADGTTTKTYTVTFTKASSAPKVQSATWTNILGSAVVDNVNMTITGQVIHGSSLTAITPTFTGVNIDSYTPTSAQDFSNGAVSYTFTSETNETTTYLVTITEEQLIAVTGVSLDKSSLSLQIGENETLVATVTPNNAANKNVSWSSSNASIASVDQTGKVSGVAAGTATITVTTEDGNKTATCTVTVTSGPPVPTTGLTTHLPEVYEAKEVAGGYNTPLTIVDGREYEVYYINRDGESKLSVSVSNADKAGSISNSTGSNSMEAKDGWFTVSSAGSGGDTGGAAKDEFKQSIRKVNMKDGCEIQLHVKGFDQFSFYGKDNSNNATKCFEVYINNVKQSTTPDNTYSIRRFDLNGESLISVKALSSSNSVFLAFSLRLAQEPRTKWIDGNDSTQVVLQTASPKPVKYFTKYNNMGETRLEWDGPTATGIKLDTLRQTALGDTLVLGGIANCPTGIYNYRVASFYNGIETSSVSGKIRVASEIKALTDTFIDAYQNEAMDEIRFRYYALNASDVQIDWANGAPAGVNTSGNNGTYIISGTPTIVGVYPFTITVTGGNSIQGKIEVKELDLGNNPVLYLYKNNLAYNRDGIFKYLTSPGGGSRNLISRKAKEEGLRPADQYAKYKWVLISEDVDADNKEILALARGEGNLPVLSMKSFSYTPGRLNWGEPNNGSLTMEEGRFITVQRADHPIFKALNKKQGDRIQVLDTVVGKGLMPISVDYLGTLCLATARTRDINDYYADGPEETFMHEVPAEMHRNQKYICLPIGLEGSNYLSASGKKLIDECIKYILGNEATIQLPDLAITEFKIGNHKGVINDNENLITITILAKDSDEMKAATPEITLASPMTFATPDKMNEDGTVDFSNWHFGVRYVVSDYINKRAYDVIVQIQAPEAIDEIEAGEWVNIFDIYGRKMTTTNQNLRTLDLPHGMYIVVTESGKSIKIMR